MEEQVVSIYASTPQKDRDSWIRKLELGDIGRYESEMLEYMKGSHADVLEAMRDSAASSRRDGAEAHRGTRCLRGHLPAERQLRRD